MASQRLEQKYWIICSIFLASNLIVSTLNHIDDTDETYGYYEPLHYLLYNTGMQTWEYAPQFAIRTYTFITPFWIFGEIFKLCNIEKLNIFYGIRILLGCFAAISESFYVVTIYANYGATIGRFTLLFVLFSSGILYCSTALLPSAVIMSVIMMSSTLWMRRQYVATIILGCVAVLWSGWPFVGILFVPFGLHMLWDTYYNSNKDYSKNSTEADVSKNININEDKSRIDYRISPKGIQNVMILCLQGFFILVITARSAAAVDFYAYKRKTFPIWNILLYNAIGEGDELYGIEASSYYIRNLFLNMSISWPLAVAAPVFLVREYLYTRLDKLDQIRNNKDVNKVNILKGNIDEQLMVDRPPIGILFLPAIIWLCVLFSRPHKEERFLYPIYPLLALMGAYSMSVIAQLFSDVISDILIWSKKVTNESKGKRSTGSSNSIGNINVNDDTDSNNSKSDNKDDRNSDSNSNIDMNISSNSNSSDIRRKAGQWSNVAKQVILILSFIVTSLLCCSRSVSNFSNFSGYLSLWTQLGRSITAINIQNFTNLIPNQDSQNKSESPTYPPVTICMGGEWYTFPSHFFLPNNARLEYIFDNFHGELPQHFNSIEGTSCEPLQMFNNMNQEEMSRYISLNSCDYFVTMISNDIKDNLKIRKISNIDKDLNILNDHKKEIKTDLNFNVKDIIDGDVIDDDAIYEIKAKNVNNNLDEETSRFRLLFSTNIIDPVRSSSALARAYFIPKISQSKNSFNKYSAFKKI